MKRIFLISLPRSGSTLTQAVLSNAPEIATTPEPWTQLFVSAFQSKSHVESNFKWGVGLDALSSIPTDEGDGTLLENLQEGLCKVEAAFIQSELKRQEAHIFLDKTPRYYYILEDLMHRYPDAHFLVLERDVISVYKSIYQTWVKGPKYPLSYCDDLIMGAPLIRDFVRNYGHRSNVYVTSYEKVVGSPSESFRLIFDWLGIRWSEQYLNFGENQSFRGQLGDQTRIKEGRLNPDGIQVAKEQNISREKFGDFINTSIARGLAHYISKRSESYPSTISWRGARPSLHFALLFLYQRLNMRKDCSKLSLLKDMVKNRGGRH